MTRICVFRGSNMGSRSVYQKAAEELGAAIVERGIDLVYGGAKVGLMGVIADAVLTAGGRVVGVMPESLVKREIAHAGLSELHVVSTMHERKALMASLSDGFIALPGGFGTFDEFCEILTWAQLGLHRAPCGLLNIEGFYNPLLQLFDHAVGEQLLRPENRAMVLAGSSVGALLDIMESYRAPVVDKWITTSQT